jgi:hypothetical protein
LIRPGMKGSYNNNTVIRKESPPGDYLVSSARKLH